METFETLSPYLDNAISMAFGLAGASIGAKLSLKQWIALQAAPKPSTVLPEPKPTKPPVSKWVALRDFMLMMGLQASIIWGIPMLKSPIILAAFWMLFCGANMAFVTYFSKHKISEPPRWTGWKYTGQPISNDLSRPSSSPLRHFRNLPLIQSLVQSVSLFVIAYLLARPSTSMSDPAVVPLRVLQYILQGAFVGAFTHMMSQTAAGSSWSSTGAGLGFKWAVIGIGGYQLACASCIGLGWFCKTFLKGTMVAAGKWLGKIFGSKEVKDAVKKQSKQSASDLVKNMPKWLTGQMMLSSRGLGYFFSALFIVMAFNVDWAIWEDSQSDPIPAGLIITLPADLILDEPKKDKPADFNLNTDTKSASTPPPLDKILIPTSLPPFPKPYFRLSLILGTLFHLIAIGFGIRDGNTLFSGMAAAWVIILGVFARAIKRGEAKKVWMFRRVWRLPVTKVLAATEDEGDDEKVVVGMLVDVSDV